VGGGGGREEMGGEVGEEHKEKREKAGQREYRRTNYRQHHLRIDCTQVNEVYFKSCRELCTQSTRPHPTLPYLFTLPEVSDVRVQFINTGGGVAPTVSQLHLLWHATRMSSWCVCLCVCVCVCVFVCVCVCVVCV